MSVSGNYSLHLEKGRAWLIQVMEWITQGKASYKDIIKAATHILLSYSIKLFTHQKGDGFLVHLSSQKKYKTFSSSNKNNEMLQIHILI